MFFCVQVCMWMHVRKHCLDEVMRLKNANVSIDNCRGILLQSAKLLSAIYHFRYEVWFTTWYISRCIILKLTAFIIVNINCKSCFLNMDGNLYVSEKNEGSD